MITGRKGLVDTCKTHLLQGNLFKKGNADGVSCFYRGYRRVDICALTGLINLELTLAIPGLLGKCLLASILLLVCY